MVSRISDESDDRRTVIGKYASFGEVNSVKAVEHQPDLKLESLSLWAQVRLSTARTHNILTEKRLWLSPRRVLINRPLWSGPGLSSAEANWKWFVMRS